MTGEEDGRGPRGERAPERFVGTERASSVVFPGIGNNARARSKGMRRRPPGVTAGRTGARARCTPFTGRVPVGDVPAAAAAEEEGDRVGSRPPELSGPRQSVIRSQPASTLRVARASRFVLRVHTTTTRNNNNNNISFS